MNATQTQAEITVYLTERMTYDEVVLPRDGGPGLTFAAPSGDCVQHQNALGLVDFDDIALGVAGVIVGPPGTEVAEMASGGLALYLPGNRDGLSASDAVREARACRRGLSWRRSRD